MGEQQAGSLWVEGSNPSSSTNIMNSKVQIANSIIQIRPCEVKEILKFFQHKFLFLLVLLHFLFPELNLSAKEIMILPIRGVIDLGLSALVIRAINEAENREIKTIILEMDTPGGRLDASNIICDKLLKFKSQTITYVLNQAWSAGSMIALSTDRIIMAPGSSIGSAEPRLLTGEEKTDEKVVSALRARFKAIAEQKNHNTALAQAMVDKDLVVKYIEINNKKFIVTESELEEKFAQYGESNVKVISTISEKGKLLNLSYKDAERYGLADAICNDRETMLVYLGKENTKIIELNPTWSENIVRFITHPVTSSLILGIGFWAIILALRMPGIGLPEIVGISSILLFFWGHKLAGLAEWLDLFLILLGIILILIELLLLPGFGITGGLGIVSLFAGIILILIRHPIYPPVKELKQAFNILFSSFIITFVLFLISLKIITKTKALKHIILETESVGKIEPQILEIQEGIAISDLRPSGKAKFGHKIYDVQTDGEYIEKGEKIKTIKIEGNIIKVRKV